MNEARIAAGALRSGGLHPQLADEHFGSAVWTDQFALQGFRLAVPSRRVADAVAYLRQVKAEAPGPRRRRERPVNALWRGLAILLAFVLGPAFGWLAVGGLVRRHDRSPILGVTAVVSAALVVGFLAVMVALAALAAVLNYSRPRRRSPCW